MYSIKLTDGTELKNLGLNGNNFISNTTIGDEVFKNNLATVTITTEEGSTEYKNMKLIQNKIYGDESWFILAEKTKGEIEEEKINLLLANSQLKIMEQQQALDTSLKLIADLQIQLAGGEK